MNYDVALFDMDGTLSKTDEGVSNGFRHTLAALGRAYPEDVETRLFMGPSIEWSFETLFGLEKEIIPEAVELYREYYAAKGISECQLYGGIKELLIRLKLAGVKLLTASSKPEIFVRRILEDFGVAELFDFAAGSLPDEGIYDKKAVIERALSEGGASDRSRCLMIGDRKYDVEGGLAAGMDVCGILWGYGTRDELIAAGAKFIAETTEEVGDIICG